METTENILNAFTFEGTSIATVTDEDQNIWVSANEVCAVLGYVNPRDAIGRHCRPKGVVKRDTLWPAKAGCPKPPRRSKWELN